MAESGEAHLQVWQLRRQVVVDCWIWDVGRAAPRGEYSAFECSEVKVACECERVVCP